MNHKILHISDLHFGPPYLTYVGDAVLSIAEKLKPDVVAITGDLTQRARQEQFAEAREFISALKKYCPRVIVVPGNHDIPLYRVLSRIFTPYALYKKYVSEELDTFHTFDGFAFACLNSTSPYTRIKEGRITQKQIDACKEFFSRQPEAVCRVVLMHHHIFPVPSFDGWSVLSNAKDLIDLFTSLKVDAVLSGHIHRGYVGNSLDVYSGVNRDCGVLAISCGTTTSRRGRGPEREKNSLNLIEIGGTELDVSHYMYFSTEKCFVETSRHKYARPGAPKNSVGHL